MPSRHPALVRLPLLAAALAAAAACRTSGPPPCYVRSGVGIVRAHDEAVARSWEDLCRQAAPAVQAALPGLVERPIDLWILPELADRLAHGLTWPDRIELSEAAAPEGQRFILAHELVHFLLDETWSRLPHVLEEGLCDWVAMRVDPLRAPQRRAEHAILLATLASGGLFVGTGSGPDARAWRFRADVDVERAPPLAQVLQLSDDELVALQGTREAAVIYAVGYLYVERIGPPKLRELCRVARATGRDEVPLHWLHDAADLHTRDPREFARAARALIGPAERSFVLQSPFAAVDAELATPERNE